MLAAPLILPAQLTHSQVAATDWIKLAKEGQWQIDASQLVQFDSSALALLLDLGRSAKETQQKIVVKHAPDRLQQLATLYGVADVIGLSPA